jgi:hypothetical protein
VRLLVFAFGVALLSHAPVQCSHDPGPELHREETPPEALYDLATRFKAKGDVRAYRDTLSYLAERYPSSRFAVRAKEELSAHDGGAP